MIIGIKIHKKQNKNMHINGVVSASIAFACDESNGLIYTKRQLKYFTHRIIYYNNKNYYYY